MNKDNDNKKKEKLGEVLGPWDFPPNISAKDLVVGTMNLSGVSLEQWEVQELTQMIETSEGWSWDKVNIGVGILNGKGEFSIERTPKVKRTCIIKYKKRKGQ